ncbi:MAG: hypothetical protein LAT64_00750 [Phycisphaerales bacterium]|nr:hypothetical protein [Planctomycetota bacterium]MCH8507290.1 hypothetical protein [Phycisphaerales bacterium]
MGYDLHITRKEDWSDEDGPRISRQEWLTLIECDPVLRIDTENCNRTPPNVFTVWDDPDAPDGSYWIDWTEDDVSARHQGKDFIRKLHEIASKLGAIVQGDDGEVYLPNGELDWDDQRTRDSTSRKPPLVWRLRRFFKR